MRPGTKKWKLFMAKLYGIGAAVVIVGAMFKIMHWPGAGAMLVGGLSTEAVIFFFSAFEPLHEDPKWELVYPELALAHDEEFDLHAYIDEKGESSHGGGGGSVTGITEKFDSLLEEAKIDADLLNRLGDGIRTLSDNEEGLKAVSGAAARDGGGTALRRDRGRAQHSRGHGDVAPVAGARKVARGLCGHDRGHVAQGGQMNSRLVCAGGEPRWR